MGSGGLSERSDGLSEGSDGLPKGYEGLPKGLEGLSEGSEVYSEASEGLPEGPEGLPEEHEGLRACQRGLRACQEAQGGDGRTDVQTDVRTEFLPTLQDFVPCRGRCPKRETGLISWKQSEVRDTVKELDVWELSHKSGREGDRKSVV